MSTPDFEASVSSVADHNAGGVNLIDNTGAACKSRHRITGNDLFHSCADKWCLGLQERQPDVACLNP